MSAKLLFIASLFILSAIAHECMHDKQEKPEPQFGQVEELGFSTEGDRNLGGFFGPSTTYPQIRITPSYGGVLNYGPEWTNYFQNSLIPPVVNYFQATLQNKYPFTAPIQFSASTTSVCNQPTPSMLIQGVNTDHVWMLSLQTDTSSSWVASTWACWLSAGTNRPYISSTTVNTAMFYYTSDPILHEKNTIVLLHEFTHALGFSSDLYKFFLDANGKTLNGHVTYSPFDGSTSTVLNVAPLTNRLRNFYGCSTLTGAYMENSGSGGTDGSHFERRLFAYEAMTSGNILEMQISQFTLALLEGSGWYVPNYANADPFFFGQGEGCSFTSLSNNQINTQFSEYCIYNGENGCATPGKGGAWCQSDIRSDGVMFYHTQYNYHCHNPYAGNNLRLPQLQTFGRLANSRCFTGTLATYANAWQASFCFTYSCSGAGATTVLTVNVGNYVVTCNAAGSVGVPGYSGTFNCPDPLTYCSTQGAQVCPHGCWGNGKCYSGKCVCNSGWQGLDCGLPGSS